MNRESGGNILLVSNYGSDTGYAWWLMEHFWCLLGGLYSDLGRKAFLAYPKVTSVSERVATAPMEVVEMAVPWSDNRQKAELRRFVENNDITAIYFTDQPYFSLKYGDLRDWGVEKILVHDHTPGDRPAVTGIKGWLKSVRNQVDSYCADGVLCVSELMRSRSIANGRIPDYKCHVVQNGINPLPTAVASRSETRSGLGIAAESFVVVTTGRAHPYKRFDFIIKSAAFLKKQHPDLDVVFLLVGDGPAMDELRQQVAEANLEESVRLLGFRRDVHVILQAADAALHAALGEGFSLSIVEYMSAGLPVLVPDIPSVSQAIDHRKNGLVYESHSSEGLVDHLQQLATDRSAARAMGENAKRKADSVYTLDNCSEQFVRTAKQLLELEGAASGEEDLATAQVSAFKAP